jgi:hypothetical protein
MRCTECNKEMKNGWDETKQPVDLIRYGYTLKCSECVWAKRRLDNVKKLEVIRAYTLQGKFPGGCICPSCGHDYSNLLPGPLLRTFRKVSNHLPRCRWEEPVVYFYECRRCATIRGKRCFEWVKHTTDTLTRFEAMPLDCTPKIKPRNYVYEDGFCREDFLGPAEPQ